MARVLLKAVFPTLITFFFCVADPGQIFAQQLIGVLNTTDFLSYTGFQPDITLLSPCNGPNPFSGGVSGVFTGTKMQTGNTVSASVDYVTHGLGNGFPLTAYSTGGLDIYALAQPGTQVTLTGTRTGSTMVTSSGATVSASTPNGQHTVSLLGAGSPFTININEPLFSSGNPFTTQPANAAVSAACPGYSYVTHIDLSTYLVVNNNCPGTTCGTAEAINSVAISSLPKTLTITTTSIPDVLYNTPYKFAFQASGGAPPYTWAVTVDQTYGPLNLLPFPPGLTFNSDGTITPDPTYDLVSGSYPLSITVTDSAGSSTSQSFSLTVLCGDQRDPLTDFYRTYPAINVGLIQVLQYVAIFDEFIPACSSFTTSAHSFLFSSTSQFLVGEPFTWALIRGPLTQPLSSTTGLDAWVTTFLANTAAGGYNYGPRIITSAYRDPQHNHIVSPRYPNSRHVFGDAIDLNNNSWGTPQSLNEYWAMYNAAYAAGAAYVEPYSAATKGHAHADWRDTVGLYQQ